MSKLPKEVWVDREALIRPAICSHVSKRNEFEPGVRVYRAKLIDQQFAWGFSLAILLGGLWTLGLLMTSGRL